MDVVDLILKFTPIVGPTGVVFLLWYWSDRSQARAMAAYQNTILAYREDTLGWRREIEHQIAEQRRQYDTNVELVKNYAKVADGLENLMYLNTQTITRLCDKVDGNQFCPMVRQKGKA
jgi:hypothetical protein